jgi:two-component system, chemotaxis family, CheB/CheR fusion protein
MKTRDGRPAGEPSALRRQAEERLRRHRPPDLEHAPADIQALVHELEVHQVELQVQNEELRQTEQALSEMVTAYRDLYEHAPVAYLTLDRRGTVTRANLTASALFRRERDRLIGARFETLLHPDHRDDCWLLLQEVAADGMPLARELRIGPPDRPEHWVQVQVAPDRPQPAPAHGGFRLTLTDISERRAAETALRASEARLRAVLEGTTLALWETDAEGRMRSDCRHWEAHTGLGAAECRGLSWLAAVHPDEREETKRCWREAVHELRPFDVEVRLRRPEGGWRWSNLRATPLRRDDGTVAGWIGIILDLSDRRRAEQAEGEARRKDEFIAMLGHELRNPLATIVSGLDVQRMLGPGEETEQMRERMERQAAHLVRLVDDLLDVSRITRSKIELRQEHLDLAATVREVVEAFRPQAPERRLRLDVTAQPLPMEGDRVRLNQVLTNLLSNAAKFTAASGEIRVGVGRDGDSAVVSVRDDGIGIARDKLPSVFDLFVQVQRSGTSSASGLGVGLTLVRQLVELHGGRVEAHSEGLGRGSEFIVRLPLTAAYPEPEPLPRPRPGTLASRPRVLVVDDDEDVASSLRLLLEVLGMEARVASTGPSAIDICVQWEPTHVLMDLDMPDMDGFEAARRIRECHGNRTVRLIALSGWGPDRDPERAAEAGFDLHLTKPVGIEDLKTALASLTLD